jgi:hypothetical protein
MITKLTKKQEAKFPYYVKKWTTIGLSTKKSNDKEITRIVKEIYKVSGLNEPEVIIVDSPQQAIDMGCKRDSDRYVKGYAGWSAWVDFFKTECGVKVENDLESELAQHCLMYWVYEGKSFVVRNPVEINLDDQNRPHSYNRPSMLFANGDCLCYFSGIKVPMKYVKAKTFTKKEILSEENVDIRREMVAKIGIVEAEKILGAKSVEKLSTKFGGKYELLMIDYKGDGTDRPYLKMKNPSINAYHIEGVKEGVSSVSEAIMFRMNLNEMPDNNEIAEVT